MPFFVLVQSATDAELSGPVKQVIDEALPTLLGGKPSVDEFNRDYLLRHRDSVPHLVTGKIHMTVHCGHFCVLSTGATVLYRLHPECRDEAISLITNLSYPSRNLKVRNVHVTLFLQAFTAVLFFVKCTRHLVVCYSKWPLFEAIHFHFQNELVIGNRQHKTSCSDLIVYCVTGLTFSSHY